MIATKSASPELLRLGSIREMLQSPGPCITIVLPPYRPGEAAGSPALLLKSNLQDAANQLRALSMSEVDIEAVLQPLNHLIDDEDLITGSQYSRVIFRSPSQMSQFLMTQPAKASMTIAGSFAVRRVIREFAHPSDFYILAISKTKVTLLQCTGLHIEAVDLPAGVPDTLAEALNLDQPGDNFENHSSAGHSLGAKHAVSFGTGSARQTAQAHLTDFYRIVDQGLNDLLHATQAPLVLAGVEQDVVIYHSINTNPALVKESIFRSPDTARDLVEMLRQATNILRKKAADHDAAAFVAARERNAPARFSAEPAVVLQAAFEGRVAHMYINEGTEWVDRFESPTYRSQGREDLLNLAAVQTMVHQGKVSELPAAMMPTGTIVAAFMRY